MNRMDVDPAWQRHAPDDPELDEHARSARRRKIILVAAIAVIAAIIILAMVLMRGGSDSKAPTPANPAGTQDAPRVTVIVPGRQQIVNVITATGTLAARRDMPVGVAGEGGMVSRVLVEAGAWVRAGQTLAVIERSVQAEEARQLAAGIDVARADAALAQQELDRAQALVGRGFISKADVQRRIATRDSANARVRVAQAQFGAARARIGRLDIRAPVAGLVLSRNVEVGQVVGSGSGALFRMAEGGRMELRAMLAQEDLATVRLGSPASVTPVGSTTSHQGEVWQISPIVDPQSRQGEARIALSYSPELRPGGFASAEIRGGTVDAPLLPETAVQSDAKGNYVFIVDAQNRAVRRDIKVGETSDRGVAVIGGLNGNERVVLSAGGFLNTGDKVTPMRSAVQQ